MARSLQITCDGCGKKKGESNRWWLMGFRSEGARVLVLPLDHATDSAYPFDQRFDAVDFCGQSCVLKFIAEQMGKTQ